MSVIGSFLDCAIAVLYYSNAMVWYSLVCYGAGMAKDGAFR
jgi:hypothetical protein